MRRLGGHIMSSVFLALKPVVAALRTPRRVATPPTNTTTTLEKRSYNTSITPSSASLQPKKVFNTVQLHDDILVGLADRNSRKDIVPYHSSTRTEARNAIEIG
jgi:hypothetical protein